MSVAVKKLSVSGKSQRELDLITREVEMMSCVSHDFCVQVLGVCFQPSCVMILMDIMAASLHEKLAATVETPSAEQRFSWACQITEALAWLHNREPCVLHRDIKPSNVLIDRRRVAKLCDFGLAVTVGTLLTQTSTIRGTPSYLAPELYMSNEATQAADVYSMGIVYHELLTGKTPTHGLVPVHIMGRTIHGLGLQAEVIHRSQLASKDDPMELSLDFCHLLVACTSKEPGCRPSADEAFDRLAAMRPAIHGGLASGLAEPFDGEDGAAAVVSLVGEVGKWQLVTGVCKERRLFFRGVWRPDDAANWERRWKDGVLELWRRRPPSPRCREMLVVTYDEERNGTKLGENMRTVEVPFLQQHGIPHAFKAFSAFLRDFGKFT